MKQPNVITSDVPEVMRDEEYVDVYANQVRIASGLSDFIVTFSVIDDMGSNRMVMRDKAAIRLTMTTAKAMVLNLMAGIEAYESTIGEIPLPKSFNEQIQNLRSRVEEGLKQQTDSRSNKSK